MAHLSVVIPVYKAESCIDALHESLSAALSSISSDYEIVLVEDRGGDGSWARIMDIARRDPRVKAARLSRNFGQHHAITAGVDLCDGDWVVVMDCDLQDRPEEIPRLYAKALEGYEIVCARRGTRRDSWWKCFTSRLYVSLFNSLSGFQHDPEVTNFRIVSRKVIDVFRGLRESSRNFSAQLHWIGFNVAYVDVSHGERHSGKSSYTFAKLLNLAINSIVSYSNKPLLLFIKLGFSLSLLSFLIAGYYILCKLFFNTPISGWTSLMVSLWFIGGLIIGSLGVLGLYIGKIYEECKARPLYVIDQKINL